MEASSQIKVGVRELRGKLTHYLNLARDGITILVTSRDVVVAELKPPSSNQLPRRKGGILKGQIRISEDFDTWPNDITACFESGKL